MPKLGNYVASLENRGKNPQNTGWSLWSDIWVKGTLICDAPPSRALAQPVCTAKISVLFKFVPNIDLDLEIVLEIDLDLYQLINI